MALQMDVIPDLTILKPPPITRALLTSAPSVFAAACSLRIVLLLYGLYQDAHSPFKYTDIDYYVFTDAARYLARDQSPYQRHTYRYTPLLAWMLLPTTWNGYWFHFGKGLFALADIVAGWLLLRLLRRKGFKESEALIYSSIWLLNPMVATISTRGSSEGLLCVIVLALLWAVIEGHIGIAGMLLGFGVHFKIYPFIYGTSILWALETKDSPGPATTSLQRVLGFFNQQRITLIFASLATFSLANIVMFTLYGEEFILHTYLHHLTRIDHRHNFSPYNTLLYLSSAGFGSKWSFESLAFIPQLFLSVVAIPLAIAKKDLATSMLAQTFAFVTFNKVCTSQYFLWYLVFLPLYLPQSQFIKHPVRGVEALILWISGQALWLQQGFELEFRGKSTFVPGLWLASLAFFGINVWILGIIVEDTMEAKDEVQKNQVKSEAATSSAVIDDDGDDDGVEEIVREESVEDMVKRELRLGRNQEQNLRAYMSDIQDLMDRE